nr:hypothetical protein [Tanacetum cinerariifolium]
MSILLNWQSKDSSKSKTGQCIPIQQQIVERQESSTAQARKFGFGNANVNGEDLMRSMAARMNKITRKGGNANPEDSSNLGNFNTQPRMAVRGSLNPNYGISSSGRVINEDRSNSQSRFSKPTSHVSSGFVDFAIEGHGEGDQSRDSVAESASVPSEGFVNPNVNAGSYTNPNSVSSFGADKGLTNPNATYTNMSGRGANVSQPQATNDDRFDATSRYFLEANPYIHDHGDTEEIDSFVKDLELGKHKLWTIMSKEKSNVITKIMCNKWDALLKARSKDDDTRPSIPPSDPIVQSVDINTKSTSYVGVAGASTKEQPKFNFNFRPLVAELVFNGVNIYIPRKVVEKVSTRFEHTLYGYFIGKRLAFSVVGYNARNNREAVLESGPWKIRNTLIILKKWSMVLAYLKRNRPAFLYRSSFARCLIEVNSEADLMDVVTIGIPSLMGDDFTKETIRVEYERKLTSSAPKKGYTNVGNASKSTSRLTTTITSSKNDNIITSNSYSALNDEEEVENVYDESANLFTNTKTGGSSSFTVATG